MNKYIVQVYLNHIFFSEGQCTATFVDDGGIKFFNNIAIMADPNTFVFGTYLDLDLDRLQMISVDATGKRTGTGRIGPSNDAPGVVTKENWESSDKLSLDYNVEDMNMACVGMIICKLHSDYQGG